MKAMSKFSKFFSSCSQLFTKVFHLFGISLTIWGTEWNDITIIKQCNIKQIGEFVTFFCTNSFNVLNHYLATIYFGFYSHGWTSNNCFHSWTFLPFPLLMFLNMVPLAMSCKLINCVSILKCWRLFGDHLCTIFEY